MLLMHAHYIFDLDGRLRLRGGLAILIKPFLDDNWNCYRLLLVISHRCLLFSLDMTSLKFCSI